MGGSIDQWDSGEAPGPQGPSCWCQESDDLSASDSQPIPRSKARVLGVPIEQSFFLEVKIFMKVDLHMVGCRQFAGWRRLA